MGVIVQVRALEVTSTIAQENWVDVKLIAEAKG